MINEELSHPLEKCICCGNECPSSTVFIAYGNYGSTIFDPSPHENRCLRIYLCNECGKQKQEQGLIVEVTEIKKHSEFKTKVWDGT